MKGLKGEKLHVCLILTYNFAPLDFCNLSNCRPHGSGSCIHHQGLSLLGTTQLQETIVGCCAGGIKCGCQSYHLSNTTLNSAPFFCPSHHSSKYTRMSTQLSTCAGKKALSSSPHSQDIPNLILRTHPTSFPGNQQTTFPEHTQPHSQEITRPHSQNIPNLVPMTSSDLIPRTLPKAVCGDKRLFFGTHLHTISSSIAHTVTHTHSPPHPGIPRIPKAVEARRGIDGSILCAFFPSLMV